MLPVNQDIPFEFVIVNYGTKHVSNVPCLLVINGQTSGSFTVTLAGQSILRGAFEIRFASTGPREVGIVVDPNNTTGDINPTDNMLFETFNVTLSGGGNCEDTELLRARWSKSPNNLRAFIIHEDVDYLISTGNLLEGVAGMERHQQQGTIH